MFCFRSSAGRAAAIEAEVAASAGTADAAASSSSSSLPSPDLQLFIDNDYELQVGAAGTSGCCVVPCLLADSNTGIRIDFGHNHTVI
jgi:hypothetical protein